MSGELETVYLKLGGALITHKAVREAVRADALTHAAGDIAAVWQSGCRLIVGHGSGSFGHAAATDEDYRGHLGPAAAARVAAAARRLNTLVVDALVAHGLPALGFPGAALARADTSIEPDEAGGGARAIGPSASDETTGGTVRAVLFSSGSPVTNALAAGLLPVIYGDVVPAGTGAAICSTESLFLALLEVLPAQRVVLATDVDGVLDESGALVRILAPGHTNAHSLAQVGARVPDVTGGMAGKVRAALEMIETCPEVHVAIVNGLVAGRIRDAMMGRAVTGTVVAAALTGADA